MRVRAGPGTGKSYSLKRRVTRLLNDGVFPQRILVVTFTRVSALDLQGELAEMGVDGAESIRATTLHALAMRMLGLQSVLTRFSRAIRIISAFERDPMIADLMKRGRGKRDIRDMLLAYEGMWATLQDDKPRDAQKPEEKAFEDDLRAWLDFHDAMLMDELIPRLYRLLETNPDLLNPDRYSHVLVDEFQDLNKAEQSLCDLVAGNASVTIVGDEDQSIYGFKHAHPNGIRDWPQGKDHVDNVELVDCYRCPSLVVAAANALISVEPRSDRALLNSLPEKGRGEVHVWEHWMPAHEAARVALEVRHLVDKDVPAEDILILTRDRKYGEQMHKELLESDIPVVSYLSESATPSDSVKHSLQILTLVSDRNDRVALRWLLGEGSSTWNKGRFAKVRRACENDVDKTPWQVLCDEADGVERHGLDHRLVERFAVIRSEVEAIDMTGGVDGIVEALFPAGDSEMTEIRSIIEDESQLADPEDDQAMDVEKSLHSLLSKVRRAIDLPDERGEGEVVRLMSLHKSKGLSAPYTFILGCFDGVLPKRREADYYEELRLMYVGVTRVKADMDKGKRGVLVLSYPIRLRVGDAKRLSVEGQVDDRRPNLIIGAESPFIKDLGLKKTHTFYASDGTDPILKPHD